MRVAPCSFISCTSRKQGAAPCEPRTSWRTSSKCVVEELCERAGPCQRSGSAPHKAGGRQHWQCVPPPPLLGGGRSGAWNETEACPIERQPWLHVNCAACAMKKIELAGRTGADVYSVRNPDSASMPCPLRYTRACARPTGSGPERRCNCQAGGALPRALVWWADAVLVYKVAATALGRCPARVPRGDGVLLERSAERGNAV